MTFRRSLSVLALAIAAAVAVPAMGQSSGSSSTSAQNSQSMQAGKQVNQTRQEIQKTQVEMMRIRAKVKTDLMSKPEWASVVAAKKAAETNVDAAKRVVLTALRNKEEYKNVAKEREAAQATVTASNAPNTTVSDEDAKKAGDLLVQDGFALKKMEMDALKEDAKYTEAMSQLDSINAKMKELDSAVDLAVKEDKDYVADEAKLVQLKTQLTGQQAQLAQARKAEEDARIQAEKSRSSSGGSGSSGRR